MTYANNSYLNQIQPTEKRAALKKIARGMQWRIDTSVIKKILSKGISGVTPNIHFVACVFDVLVK